MSFLSFARQAICEENKKNWTKAFNLYTRAIELTSNLSSKIKLIARKANCLDLVGNHKEAEKLIRDLEVLFPNHPETYLQSALYFINIQNTKQAKIYLHQGIEQFPDYLEFYLTLAFILKETERSNESIEVLKKALMQEKLTNGKGGISRKDIWAELGNLYFERENYNSCLACMKKSLRMAEKELFSFYDILAICYLKLNDLTNALKYIDLHLCYYEEVDPEAYILKARIHCLLGEYEKAKQILLFVYSREGVLNLSNEELRDLSYFVQNGFLDNLENFSIDEDK